MNVNVVRHGQVRWMYKSEVLKIWAKQVASILFTSLLVISHFSKLFQKFITIRDFPHACKRLKTSLRTKSNTEFPE